MIARVDHPDMTLTTPNCPAAAQELPDHGRERGCQPFPASRVVNVNHGLGSGLDDRSRMSDEARATLNMW